MDAERPQPLRDIQAEAESAFWQQDFTMMRVGKNKTTLCVEVDGESYYVDCIFYPCWECDGEGMVEDEEDDDSYNFVTCDECEGHGVSLRNYEILWRDALTKAEHDSIERQEYLLKRRYGTTKPVSIADYWQKQA